jgi:hypothetical protein
MVEGCRAWREWSRGDIAIVATQEVVQTRAQAETPHKSSWWQYIHIDALWLMTQSGSNTFGIAGTHASIPLSNRIQVFIAPGVILMRVPTGGAGEQWTAATDWGFSYRVVDFMIPAMRRPTSLHLNVARVWILGNRTVQLQRDLYLAGFSVTFRRQ